MADKETRHKVSDLNGRAWEYLTRILVTLMVPLLIWHATVLYDLTKDVASIKANRFTSADGLEVWKQIGKIHEVLAAMPQENPPEGFVNQVEKLSERMDRCESELRTKTRVK